MKVKLKKYKKVKFKSLHTPKDIKENLFSILRVILIILLICISFIIECSGFYVKPILFIPIALCVAIFSENELNSAIFGGLCGLLLDIACHKLFGFNGVLFIIGCVFTTLMFKNYLKPMLANAVIYTIIFTLAQGFIDYFFYYRVWNSQTSDIIYFEYTLPSCIMTIISVIVIYPIIKHIRSKLVAR